MRLSLCISCGKYKLSRWVILPKGNNNNFIPFDERTDSEQTEIRKKGGIASGESRRQRREERNRLKKIAQLIPNMEIFLESDENKKNFDMLGIEGEDINDVEALTDLKLVLAALNGDLGAKKYFDERMGNSEIIKIKKAELALRKKELEFKKSLVTKDTDTEASKLDIIVNRLLNEE